MPIKTRQAKFYTVRKFKLERQTNPDIPTPDEKQIVPNRQAAEIHIQLLTVDTRSEQHNTEQHNTEQHNTEQHNTEA